MLRRALHLPSHPKTSFFLWGPRQTGKSTLLRALYPRARRIDLLTSREFVRFSRDPTDLREEVEAAGDCGVSAYTVKQYFQILVDTLLGRFLPAFQKRPKRRVIQAPKFYLADVGLVNHLAKRHWLEPEAPLFGAAFENWVFHELSAYRAYHGFPFDLCHWRLASGIEVDFVFDDLRLAVEAKATPRVHADHLKGLRELVRDHPRVRQRVVVSLDERPRRTEDGIDVLPARVFAQRLWAGDLEAV